MELRKAQLIANNGVTPGSYTNANITVDAQGRVTVASNGTAGSGGTVTSIATGSGLTGGPVTSTGTISLADTAVTPGSYTNSNITVDAQGRITAASSGTAGASTSLKIISDVSALPSSPVEGDVIEITNSTNIQSTAGVTSVPVGFVGSPDLAVWLQRVGSNWVWVNYSANDPDARYAAYAPGSAEYQALAAASAVTSSSTPVGTIVWLQSPELSPPDGWLYCNGVDKQRAQYNVLFNAIGTTYGNGDGLTTFGFPLEANLTPPVYAVDSSWNPFMKYGTRTSNPGMIVARYLGYTSVALNFVSGTTQGSTLTVNSMPSGVNSNPSISLDASFLTVSIDNTTTRNAYVWKRSGLSYNLLPCVPALVNTGTVMTGAAVSPNGVYVAYVSGAARNKAWVYKANSNFTQYNFLTEVTLTDPLNDDPLDLQWSRNGNFFYWCSYSSLSRFNKVKVVSRSGDSFTECAPVELPAQDFVRGLQMSPDENFLAVGGQDNMYMFSRAGNAFSYLTAAFRNYNGWGPAWNLDGTVIVAGKNDTADGMDAWTWNGSGLVALSEGVKLTDRGGNPIFSLIDSNVFYIPSFFSGTAGYAGSVAGGTLNYTATVSGGGWGGGSRPSIGLTVD